MSEMTRAERTELAGLVRKRARVAKDEARARSASDAARVEEQLSQQFSAEDDRWKLAVDAAKAATEVANQQIDVACEQLNLPKEMRPSLGLNFYSRGSSSSASRRDELRQLARARIDERLKSALTEIERKSVAVQTDLLVDGLTTGAAQEFLLAMPTAESLLPALDLDALQLESRRA